MESSPVSSQATTFNAHGELTKQEGSWRWHLRLGRNYTGGRFTSNSFKCKLLKPPTPPNFSVNKSESCQSKQSICFQSAPFVRRDKTPQREKNNLVVNKHKVAST